MHLPHHQFPLILLPSLLSPLSSLHAPLSSVFLLYLSLSSYRYSGKTYFWYGESQKNNNESTHGVNCYSSADLVCTLSYLLLAPSSLSHSSFLLFFIVLIISQLNWHFEGMILYQQDITHVSEAGPYIVLPQPLPPFLLLLFLLLPFSYSPSPLLPLLTSLSLFCDIGGETKSDIQLKHQIVCSVVPFR